VPARSDTVLVTSYTYDPAGRLRDLTDPRGIATRSAYDLAGQVLSRTEAFSTADERLTNFTYDGLGRTLTIRALNGAAAAQTTAYVYGVTGGLIESHDLLREVRYPDKVSGEASSLPQDSVHYTWNAVGEP
jgi:YD repeat-containing protein